MSVRLRRPARPEASSDGAGPDAGMRRRRLAPVALAAAALSAGGLAAMALLGGDEAGDRPGLRAAGSTATVTRQTLVERETVEGTLGYAGIRTVLNRLATAGGGSGTGTPGASGEESEGGTAPARSSEADGAATIPAAYFASGQADSVGKDAPPSESPAAESPSSESPSGESPPGDSPSEKSPSRSAPDGSAPERSGRGGSAPDDSGPGGSAPDGSAPEGSAPRGSAPEGSAPGGSAPEDSAPRASAPAGSGPGRSAPSSPSAGAAPPADASATGGSPSGSSTVPDSSDAAGSGTVTALPRPGSVVRRGGALYRVDGEPVVLMYGATPAYRDLQLGVEDGHDVRQLEHNLAALGFDPGTVDTEFTSTTAAAVTDWQESAGLPETGAVELGRVVFLPGARRIGEHHTSVGSVLSEGSEVLDTSSTRRVVTIELDAALQSLARKGDRVEVTLPDQSAVRGRIADVGRVAREKEGTDAADPGAGAGAEQELVIDVTVRLRSARGIGRLDEAPVSVGLAQESSKNVLAVPVEALVARRGGGYGVELAAGRRVVPVETGLFAGGYVEVKGTGIREGARVVVPDA